MELDINFYQMKCMTMNNTGNVSISLEILISTAICAI